MRILIIGGGYSGVTFAVQALIQSGYRIDAGQLPGRSLRIEIVEPLAELGRGVAYSSRDPDHRINAPSFSHMAMGSDQSHFSEWFKSSGGLQHDPQAESGGLLFPRRQEFGRYLGSLLTRAQADGVVLHHRDRAARLLDDGHRLVLLTASGARLEADRVVLATGHLPGVTPRFVSAAAAAHSGFLRTPWDARALAAVTPDARVLILGSGLTAADVIATLVRGAHRGKIHVISRRGLRPKPLPVPVPVPVPVAAAAVPGSSPTPPVVIWDQLKKPIADYLLESFDGKPSVRQLLRTLRARVAQRAGEGVAWYEAFDELRDGFSRLWVQLDSRDQRRFHHHLKPWYDVYRYRMPPQTGALIARGEASGLLNFEAARVVKIDRSRGDDSLLAVIRPRGSATEREQGFDGVINCTGPGQLLNGADPFLDTLLRDGMVRPHASGFGLDIDLQMRAVNSGGRIDPRIHVIGPPSAGALGDPIGAVFICAHINRLMGRFFDDASS